MLQQLQTHPDLKNCCMSPQPQTTKDQFDFLAEITDILTKIKDDQGLASVSESILQPYNPDEKRKKPEYE